MTIRTSVKWGSAVGSLGTLVALAYYLTAWHQGANMNGVGFGLSIDLFVLSFPWSFVVWGLLLAIHMLTGADGTVFNAPFFFCMPIVAGAGWGWVIGELRRRFRWTAADKSS